MKSKWSRLGFKTLRVVLLVYFGLALLVYLFPNGLIFFPEKYPSGDWTPPAGAIDVFFQASDGTRLHGWYRKVNDGSPTFLVMHGNAGNIAGRKHLFTDLKDANVFLFDYRGFGRSEGSPFEEGVARDAEAAYDYLVKDRKVDPKRIVLLGQSLGGVFACRLAQKRECKALILEAPFSSARDMAGAMLPLLPLGWALGVEMDNVTRIKSVSAPVLVVHGDQDRVIPNQLGKKLFEAARSKKSFISFEGGGHNDLWDKFGKRYLASINDFLSSVDRRFDWGRSAIGQSLRTSPFPTL